MYFVPRPSLKRRGETLQKREWIPLATAVYIVRGLLCLPARRPRGWGMIPPVFVDEIYVCSPIEGSRTEHTVNPHLSTAVDTYWIATLGDVAPYFYSRRIVAYWGLSLQVVSLAERVERRAGGGAQNCLRMFGM